MAERASAYAINVFFNCPFDDEYKAIFDALIFAAFDCGYIPRCALELPDILSAMGVHPNEMIFADYTNIVSTWLLEHPR